MREPEGPGDGLTICPADGRFASTRPGITTRHCFSFGEGYDPTNVSFGSLVALNDEVLAPGACYAAHEHRDIDIVTWVLEGTLTHEDSTGARAAITKGTVQRLTAGTGVSHSESNGGAPGESLRFVQMWFALHGADVPPSYDAWTMEDDDRHGFTTVAASPDVAAPRRTTLATPGVEVVVGHLHPGDTGWIDMSGTARRQSYAYVIGGRLRTPGVSDLVEGDQVRSSGLGRPCRT